MLDVPKRIWVEFGFNFRLQRRRREFLSGIMWSAPDKESPYNEHGYVLVDAANRVARERFWTGLVAGAALACLVLW